AIHRDAGVRAKQIDAALFADDPFDEAHVVRFARDVGLERQAVDLGGHALGADEVDVRDDDRLRAFGGKPATQRPADAVGTAGDYDDFAGKIHVSSKYEVRSTKTAFFILRTSYFVLLRLHPTAQAFDVFRHRPRRCEEHDREQGSEDRHDEHRRVETVGAERLE